MLNPYSQFARRSFLICRTYSILLFNKMKERETLCDLATTAETKRDDIRDRRVGTLVRWRKRHERGADRTENRRGEMKRSSKRKQRRRSRHRVGTRRRAWQLASLMVLVTADALRGINDARDDAKCVMVMVAGRDGDGDGGGSTARISCYGARLQHLFHARRSEEKGARERERENEQESERKRDKPAPSCRGRRHSRRSFPLFASRPFSRGARANAVSLDRDPRRPSINTRSFKK